MAACNIDRSVRNMSAGYGRGSYGYVSETCNSGGRLPGAARGMETAMAQGRYRINENRTGMRVGTSEMPRVIRVPSGTGHPMKYGDRMLVRLDLPEGGTLSFESRALSDITEVLGEVRRLARGHVGLGRLSIRNASEGWRVERPLKLYAGVFAPRGFGNVRVHEPAPDPAPVKTQRMPFPWETH